MEQQHLHNWHSHIQSQPMSLHHPQQPMHLIWQTNTCRENWKWVTMKRTMEPTRLNRGPIWPPRRVLCHCLDYKATLHNQPDDWQSTHCSTTDWTIQPCHLRMKWIWRNQQNVVTIQESLHWSIGHMANKWHNIWPPWICQCSFHHCRWPQPSIHPRQNCAANGIHRNGQ